MLGPALAMLRMPGLVCLTAFHQQTISYLLLVIQQKAVTNPA